MQLYIVQPVVIGMRDNRLWHLVDKHSHTLYLLGALGNLAVCHIGYYASLHLYAADISRTLGPEYEAHQVNAEFRHLLYVLRLAHAANLY